MATENPVRPTHLSRVAFTADERMIGDAAKNQIAVNVKNTVFDAKRLIGRRFSDPVVQEDMKHWSFVAALDGDKPLIQVEFKGRRSGSRRRSRRSSCRRCRRRQWRSWGRRSRTLPSHALRTSTTHSGMRRRTWGWLFGERDADHQRTNGGGDGVRT